MAGELKKVECDPKCGFMVQSHDEKELIEMASQHGKKFHPKETAGMTASDVQKLIKVA